MHTEPRPPVSKSVIYANSVGTQRKLLSNVQLAAILELHRREKFQMGKHEREEDDLLQRDLTPDWSSFTLHPS